MGPDPAREMLLALAIFHGVPDEVAEAVKGKPSPRFQRLDALLRDARVAQGLRLSDIHDRCGLSKSQLSFYENGQAKNPGLRTIRTLAYGYRLPLARVLISALQDC